MIPVVVLGSGGHAKVVIDILRATGGFDLVGCVMDDSDPSRLVAGSPIIGGLARMATLAEEGVCVAIGIGGLADNFERRLMFERAVDHGLEIISAIHPHAHIAPSATIGTGSVICAGAIVGVEVKVGCNVVVNTNASIDHESIVGDHCLLAPGVTVAGHVSVEHNAFIATGATVAPRVRIGAGSLVAAGSVVVDDVPSGMSVRGVPARPR